MGCGQKVGGGFNLTLALYTSHTISACTLIKCMLPTCTVIVVCVLIQVLQVVNPHCTFACGQGGKSTPGVAVVLRELLGKLDDLGIDHKDEPSIRRQLRSLAEKSVSVKTSANQHFLKKGATDTKIDRKTANTRNVSCIILSRRDIPECFFRMLDTGTQNNKSFLFLAMKVGWVEVLATCVFKVILTAEQILHMHMYLHKSGPTP